MFDISFTGETNEDWNEVLYFGELTLGKSTEGFAASFSFWSKEDYQKHWFDAARRFLNSHTSSAFITCMYNPETANFIRWWQAWRNDNLIIFQNSLLFIGAKPGEEFYDPLTERFSLENPYNAVGDWDLSHTEECQKSGICRSYRLGVSGLDLDAEVCPSEWVVFLSDLEEFVIRRGQEWGLDSF